jgi:hypothetical protein
VCDISDQIHCQRPSFVCGLCGRCVHCENILVALRAELFLLRMPIAKHRADLAELISIAALKRKQILQRQRRRHTVVKRNSSITRNGSVDIRRDLQRKVSLEAPNSHQIASKNPHNHSFTEGDQIGEFVKEFQGGQGTSNPIFYIFEGLFLHLSHQVCWFQDLLLVRVIRLIITVLAFITLTFEASQAKDTPSLIDFVTYTDIVIDSLFLIDGLLKFIALYSQFTTFTASFNSQRFVKFLRKGGIIDIIIASLSLALARNPGGNWVRLARVLLISSFALEELPHLEVLVVSIFR